MIPELASFIYLWKELFGTGNEKVIMRTEGIIRHWKRKSHLTYA
jgi:hypothetical protein